MIRTLFQHVVLFIAAAYVRRYRPLVIGITGSVGKTTTREAMAAVFRSSFRVRQSEKNYNNLIGVPLSILGVPAPEGWRGKIDACKALFNAFVSTFLLRDKKSPQVLILEYGADRPGDIQSLASIFPPDIAVVTCIGNEPVHLENYNDINELVREKGYLVEYVKQGGLAILNHDDPRVRGMQRRTKARVVMVASHNEVAFWLKSSRLVVAEDGQIGIDATIRAAGQVKNFFIPGAIGTHQALDCLPAIAAGVFRHISLDMIAASLQTIRFPRGRMRLIEGKNNSLILDDTYNASPLSTREALLSLKNFSRVLGDFRGRPVTTFAFLADMKELGSVSDQAHYDIGRLASDCVQNLVAVGDSAHHLARGAADCGLQSHVFLNSYEAAAYAIKVAQQDAIILVKGSQSMRMERVVKAIMQDSSQAHELLVRQTPEWLNKE